MNKRPKALEAGREPPDELMIAFGQRVKEARVRADLTYAQLGELTDLAPSYLFVMEKEGGNVTLKTLGKIAFALKLSPRDLLPESEHDLLAGSAIAELVADLQVALSERQSQEATILDRLHGLSAMLERLRRLSGKPQGD